MCDTQLSVPTPYGCKGHHRNQFGCHTHGSDAVCVEVAKIKASTKRRTLDTMELLSANSQPSCQIHWAVCSRMNAKHISNQKVDSTCTGSKWSTPANTYRSRISCCTRPVQILPSFTRRRRTIPTRRQWTSRSQSRDDFWMGQQSQLGPRDGSRVYRRYV